MTIYRRVLTGQVAPGQHGDFLAALEAALDYQAQRGVEARFAVWDSITAVFSRATSALQRWVSHIAGRAP